MLKNVVSKPVSIVKHVNRHKGTYIMGGVALALLLLVIRNNEAMEEFLIEKGIDPTEFFSPEYFAELHSVKA